MGTAYRRAKGLSGDQLWKRNALANVYHTQMHLDDGRGPARLHMYRHGVSGYTTERHTDEIRRVAAGQLVQLLRHAQAKQAQSALPPRVVSANLMDHSMESEMIQLQHLAWEEVFQEGGPGICREHFCELQLPCNTDLVSKLCPSK